MKLPKLRYSTPAFLEFKGGKKASMRVPFGYGFAYDAVDKLVRFYYPIPLNYLVGLGRKIRGWVAKKGG